MRTEEDTMRQNCREVMEAWNSNEPHKKCRAIWTDGDNVYSYGTCIVAYYESCNYEVQPTEAVVNVTKYSQTTTTHQNGILEWLYGRGFSPFKVQGLMRGVSAQDILRKFAETFEDLYGYALPTPKEV